MTLPASTPPAPASRLRVTLLGALLFGVLCPPLFGGALFLASLRLPNQYAQQAGIFLMFFAGAAGLFVGPVVGALLSALGDPARVARRWAFGAGALVLLSFLAGVLLVLRGG